MHSLSFFDALIFHIWSETIHSMEKKETEERNMWPIWRFLLSRKERSDWLRKKVGKNDTFSYETIKEGRKSIFTLVYGIRKE